MGNPSYWASPEAFEKLVSTLRQTVKLVELHADDGGKLAKRFAPDLKPKRAAKLAQSIVRDVDDNRVFTTNLGGHMTLVFCERRATKGRHLLVILTTYRDKKLRDEFILHFESMGLISGMIIAGPRRRAGRVFLVESEVAAAPARPIHHRGILHEWPSRHVALFLSKNPAVPSYLAVT